MWRGSVCWKDGFAHKNYPINLIGSALGLNLDPYAPGDRGVHMFVCVCVSVTFWFLKYLPRDHLS